MTVTDNLHLQFPSDFSWGVATSAFQIEGASHADGKGESIWDHFCRQPDVIVDGSTGDIACDHYNRLEADLDLIASLGVDTYRFSISWPRVQPLGEGAWNEAGLAFYERLVNGLWQRNIRPHITLNHWDLPQALQNKGGWNARETVHHFVRYAQGVYQRLGHRMGAITTHNEPWVMAVLGHELGIFAPGIKDKKVSIQVAHHLLLSHGMAVQALRQDGCTLPLGIVLNMASFEPASGSAADAAKVKQDKAEGLGWYLDPLFKGHYPEEVLADLGSNAPDMESDDLSIIASPIDFLGINYYSRHVSSADGSFDAKHSGLILTEMGWEIYPQGLTDLLLDLKATYTLPPVYITENGGAFKDRVVNGHVLDHDRLEYLQAHVAAVAKALAAGVHVKGYMVWSLMDNFEWASGYEKRFGIVHVDYTTQQRTLKTSAKWYQSLMKDFRAQLREDKKDHA
jgi:beta-glucosidase